MEFPNDIFLKLFLKVVVKKNSFALDHCKLQKDQANALINKIFLENY
jgi:hypothetical protein